MSQLDRPIFIVGFPSAGSAMLAAIINWHSRVGPKWPFMVHCPSISRFLSTLRQPLGPFDNASVHSCYNNFIERIRDGSHLCNCLPGTWNYRQGKELFSGRLLAHFNQKRLLWKAPRNWKNLHSLSVPFPDARIIALFRSAPDYIASRLERRPGIIEAHGGYPEAIKYVHKIGRQCIEKMQTCEHFKILEVFYEDLIRDTRNQLQKIMDFCQLEREDYLSEVSLSDTRINTWRRRIPESFHYLLEELDNYEGA